MYAAALAWLFATDQVGLVAAGKWSLVALLNRSPDLLVLGLMVPLIFVRRRWWHLIVPLALWSGPIGWLSRSLRDPLRQALQPPSIS